MDRAEIRSRAAALLRGWGIEPPRELTDPPAETDAQRAQELLRAMGIQESGAGATRPAERDSAHG